MSAVATVEPRVQDNVTDDQPAVRNHHDAELPNVLGPRLLSTESITVRHRGDLAPESPIPAIAGRPRWADDGGVQTPTPAAGGASHTPPPSGGIGVLPRLTSAARTPATNTSLVSVVGAFARTYLPYSRSRGGTQANVGQTTNDGAAWAALADGNEVVVGVPLDDNGLARVVRYVIVLAATGGTFYTCLFINGLLQTREDLSSLWTAVSSLLIELSIPACGYFGALYCNRQLTCCFCSGNLFVTIVSIMSFVRIHIHVAEIKGRCERESNVDQRTICEVWMSGGVDKYALICRTLIIVCVGGLAFWFGNSLYNKLAQGITISHPGAQPLIGEVIPFSELPSFAATQFNFSPPQVAARSDERATSSEDPSVSGDTLGRNVTGDNGDERSARGPNANSLSLGDDVTRFVASETPRLGSDNDVVIDVVGATSATTEADDTVLDPVTPATQGPTVVTIPPAERGSSSGMSSNMATDVAAGRRRGDGNDGHFEANNRSHSASGSSSSSSNSVRIAFPAPALGVRPGE
eukprot:TRINITY_DN10593_c0_g2_i1.p1 TRINITY_DN10593_c0_g2~~TRINITY_DN10593_c0_g2_i1.p1  ORF type:complete len:522 (-),score=76.85 TRINITY_DN10593_c0_g2_i1:34-1599(-)